MRDDDSDGRVFHLIVTPKYGKTSYTSFDDLDSLLTALAALGGAADQIFLIEGGTRWETAAKPLALRSPAGVVSAPSRPDDSEIWFNDDGVVGDGPPERLSGDGGGDLDIGGGDGFPPML